ncbi:MAG: AAA family ATPase [Chloroflexota bacterium]
MFTTRLPTSATPFIGRAEELAEIALLLADSTCRLLTLIGPGGIGKTRLALEVARSLTFPNCIYFVSLQPLTSPELVVPAIADALQFQFYSGGEPQQQLLDYLREKSLLLLLDNFEHLLDGVTSLSDMLAAAPFVKLLVTSRERLNLREEWLFEVQGLSFPTSETEANFETYDAVQLFVQHARRTHSSFILTDRRKPAVARICRLLGGMPLGVELAASWVRSLPCGQIADEIEHSLEILETSVHNMPLRHRNMRAVFTPTWERLSAVEQDVFMKLSVFRGGFTTEAAGAAFLSPLARDGRTHPVDRSGGFLHIGKRTERAPLFEFSALRRQLLAHTIKRVLT